MVVDVSRARRGAHHADSRQARHVRRTSRRSGALLSRIGSVLVAVVMFLASTARATGDEVVDAAYVVQRDRPVRALPPPDGRAQDGDFAAAAGTSLAGAALGAAICGGVPLLGCTLVCSMLGTTAFVGPVAGLIVAFLPPALIVASAMLGGTSVVASFLAAGVVFDPPRAAGSARDREAEPGPAVAPSTAMRWGIRSVTAGATALLAIAAAPVGGVAGALVGQQLGVPVWFPGLEFAPSPTLPTAAVVCIGAGVAFGVVATIGAAVNVAVVAGTVE
jgi:hypothetical protein